ncbi:hypothetical protein R1sor_014380 [Riccia sorocarpa]|uniref:Glucuronosyltransferase PGSIP8 n=1 Tax=Riccia sorocarpa TaxID=122646 RepID=A0ABD3HB28_9MARC
MAEPKLTCSRVGLAFVLATLVLLAGPQQADATHAPVVKSSAKNAYATMLYMGTPRDYEFYVAARVMLQSLARLKVDADLVVIASSAVPIKWRRNFLKDGIRLVIVEDIQNPYRNQPDFDMRFMFTLNKIYAWTLTDYERVVMLDVDNLFLQKADELFQCGEFCAAFINPCIFHTGLFVLEPSNETFNAMLSDIQSGRENRDGADQGFLTAHFSDLLDKPLFHPPTNGTKLKGIYRLPLGYQMDASYYYLKLKWSVPCGPNSVVTFPSVPMLKPWYWWAYPVLPLGLSWHEQRRHTIGYGSELPLMAAEALFYIITMIVAMIVRQRVLTTDRPPLIKSCLGRGPCSIESGSIVQPFLLKVAAIFAIIASFAIPFVLVPTTAHPLMGWALWLLGSQSLLIVTINIFQLPVLPVLTPWLGFFGVLLVMAAPIYSNGIIRALAIFGYAFLASPLLWWMLTQVSASIDLAFAREPLMAYANMRKKEMIEEW